MPSEPGLTVGESRLISFWGDQRWRAVLIREQTAPDDLARTASPKPTSEQEMRRWLHVLVDALEAPDLAQILVPAAILLRLNTRRG